MAKNQHDLKELQRKARRQGWVIEATGSNGLRWKPPWGSPHVFTSRTPENRYAINMIEKDLIKGGLKLGVTYEKRERPMPSVGDLIKANGEGTPIFEVKPPALEPTAARMDRTGIPRDVLVILKAIYPMEMDSTTLFMRLAMNHPGAKPATIYPYLAKMKAAGKIVSTRMGYYRAASADIILDGPMTSVSAPVEPLIPVLPNEYKAVIEGLLKAAADAEKLIVRLTRQLAEQTEASEAIKRLAAKL